MKYPIKIISVFLILFFISLTAVSATDVSAEINSQIDDNTDEIITIDGQSTTANKGFYELQQQIWSSSAGDTITIENDYYNDGVRANGITIDRSITLDGQGHTFDGNNSDRIISIQKEGKGIENVIIKNINFINGKKDTGGAIFANSGSHNLIIVNCTFTNNQATTNNIGGAIYIKESNGCTITENTFKDNTALGSGGAIRIEGNAEKITNNTFTNNIAKNSLGGAISALGHDTTITDNTFNSNVAGRDGGAIDIEGTKVNDIGKRNVISNNIFTSNKATGSNEGNYGGAISIKGQDCTISNNNFTKNQADTLGGAIRWNGASSNTGKITGNDFDTNNAPSGGAIYASASGITISQNTFSNNKATNGAGGSINVKGASNTISNNEIKKSSSKTSGGAIYIDGKSNKILNNNITECTAGDNGGALYLTGASATITGNKFIKNTATKLAGAAQIKTSSASIKNNEFTENSAKQSGGAAYIEGTKITLSGNTFTKNQAGSTSVGGAVRWTGTNAVITNNKFVSNTAKVGFAIYGSGEDKKISGNTYSPKKTDTERWEKTKTKLTTPTKTFKKSAKTKKVTITLKSSNNKVLKSKKITLKVNGKTYSAKTNSKGQATINVKLSKKKTFTYTVKFAGDSDYDKVSKNGKIKIK